MVVCHIIRDISIYEDQVLDLVDPPKDVKLIGRTWSYKINRHGCSHLQDIQLVEKEGYDKVESVDYHKI
jgi:hypothetical protein